MKKTTNVPAPKVKKITKTELVKKHLLKKKNITSWQAIELYGATRLAAMIFDLRDAKWDIITKKISAKDRFGNDITFAKYVLNTK